MEPRIQYAQTSDGVSIAYCTLGEGLPFVSMPVVPMSSMETEMRFPEFRSWHERVAQERRLIRYDCRGAGLSERDVTEFSIEAYAVDLEAVVDALGLETFALFAAGAAGPVAIAFAAQNPGRVSHVILWHSFARTAEVVDEVRWQALVSLADADWEMFTETFAHTFQGWSAGEAARRIAELFRDGITRDTARVAYEAIRRFDSTAFLSQVKSPTLVLHRRGYSFLEVGVARRLASQIPDAQLSILEGNVFAWYLGDSESVLRAIDDFLAEDEEAEERAKPPEVGAFRTVLFTDVEGSTALTRRLGDAKARDLLREHERIVREALKAHGGSELKTTGDGFMASFSSATKALESALAMQRAFAAHNESAEEPILVRVGMNAGEPIAEEADLFGTAVNLAARICGYAEAGQILVSDVVQQLAAGKGFTFADKGEATLKGFEKPVRLYEVRWGEER